jgi:hypothetical protein
MKMTRNSAVGVLAAALLAGACAEGTSPVEATLQPRGVSRALVTWTGNGTTDGSCNRVYTFPYATPIPPAALLSPGAPGAGQQLWHFVFTQANDDNTKNKLTAAFNDGTVVTDLASQSQNGSEANFFVLTAAGAKLTSASAVEGNDSPPPESQLTISGCWLSETTVRPAADLTVSKDGAGTYDKTWAYNVVKTSDAASVVRTSATTFTINYTVTATRTGPTLSNFAVAGTITVSNPNLGAVTLSSLTDALSDGTSCTVDVSGGLSIPAGALVSDVMVPGTKQYPYSCSLSTTTVPTELSNKVTAAWATQTPENTGELKGGSTDFTFGISFAGHDVNPSADVYDAYNGGAEEKIGTISSDGPVEFKFAKTVNVSANACVTVTNSARVEQATSSVSNTICAKQTGGLTIGYWGNTNGQKQIASSAATAGVCNLTSYLRGFQAFVAGLSSTASCSTVATYVLNVVKAANASGATMTAMLKAQMLATALSVYFNASLGGAAIDLAKVCTDLTCTAYENVGPAGFTGASKTVNQLLAIADSHVGDAGGWYGGVKLTQELAKDTFDMINNNLATIYAGP